MYFLNPTLHHGLCRLLKCTRSPESKCTVVFNLLSIIVDVTLNIYRLLLFSYDLFLSKILNFVKGTLARGLFLKWLIFGINRPMLLLLARIFISARRSTSDVF